MTKQDDLTRRRRLNKGQCPTHGTTLCQIGHNDEGPIVGCSRGDCGFTYTVEPGSKVWDAMVGEGPQVYVVARDGDNDEWLTSSDVIWTRNLNIAIVYATEGQAQMASNLWGGHPEVMSEAVYKRICHETADEA